MATTFYELLVDAYAQTRLQGSPGSVLDTGLVTTLANSLKQAWIDLQTDQEDWKFMKAVFNDFYTVTGQSIYTPAEVFGASVDNFGSYYPDKIYIYGEKRPINWADFESFHVLNLDKDPGPPSFVCTETSAGELYINTPDVPARLQIFYVRATQTLELDTDVIQLIDKYIPAIMWRGLELYAITTGNNNLRIKAVAGFDSTYGNTLRKYNPQKKLRPRKFLI